MLKWLDSQKDPAPGTKNLQHGQSPYHDNDNDHEGLAFLGTRLALTSDEWQRPPFGADSGHPPPHSITSSARASNAGATLRPSVLAVLRLMTSSTLVACCTGRSAGFSPLIMRPV